jgi:ATP-binding cassette, subfamily G (WHITE), member 2, SNQ2
MVLLGIHFSSYTNCSSLISARGPTLYSADGSLAYGFEALMVNEFNNLELTCTPPQLIPSYGTPANQGCTLAGAIAGSTVVDGEAYLHAQLGYSYSHLWRNVGIILAFWVFFVLLTLFGMELALKPGKGGGNVTIFKQGAISPLHDDEEAQRSRPIIQRNEDESEVDLAKIHTVFTWSDVRYDIKVKGGKKVLLDDIKGYVKPGRLTALMGGKSSKHKANGRIRSWKNNFVKLPIKTGICRSPQWEDSD